MNLPAVRQRQSELKAHYRANPEDAITPVHAEGSFDDPGITCTVEGWAGPVRAGLHEATGGDGSDACSGDLLLQALMACAGVTLRSVAGALGVTVRSARLVAQGQFDARGTLAVSRDAPIGVSNIRLVAELDTDADDAALARLGELTERYCVVAQTLAERPRLVIRRAAGKRNGTNGG